MENKYMLMLGVHYHLILAAFHLAPNHRLELSASHIEMAGESHFLGRNLRWIPSVYSNTVLPSKQAKRTQCKIQGKPQIDRKRKWEASVIQKKEEVG